MIALLFRESCCLSWVWVTTILGDPKPWPGDKSFFLSLLCYLSVLILFFSMLFFNKTGLVVDRQLSVRLKPGLAEVCLHTAWCCVTGGRAYWCSTQRWFLGHIKIIFRLKCVIVLQWSSPFRKNNMTELSCIQKIFVLLCLAFCCDNLHFYSHTNWSLQNLAQKI